ncbi:MAG: SAM-dependent methyltransferase [Lachnospiraceae bacterium]|nr:SAM-dependent methyltransferase [Lachnospiraceae bacterium]
MELSKRLQAVADLLDYHEAVADIGCDHGYVSIYLIESKKASQCLAMDVNQGPLERAREHVNEKQLSTYIETRLSDGAKALKFFSREDGTMALEVQAALIAGMGGRLMVKIIEDSLEKFKSMEEFVLQPQSEIPKVRQYVRAMGYHIQKEDMVLEDGKFYPMMKVVRGKKVEKDVFHIPTYLQQRIDDEGFQLQELYDEYGEFLLQNKNQVLYQFLNYEKKLYLGIQKSLKETESLKSEIRHREIEEKLKRINLGLEWFKDEM